MTGGHLLLACTDIDTAVLVADAVSEVRGAADAAGIRIETDVAATPVTVDADRIVQALTNLLANAVKFSPPGGTVRVTEVALEGEVTLTVVDEGRGIPEDAHERIFTRFGQADVSDRREKSGTGLGLPIARGLVEQHGGRLEVDSRPGEGSRFLLTLPRDGEVTG